MTPIAYSVSPLRRFQMCGGKNSEKRSTRMPTFFAAAKWPNSCSDDQEREAEEREEVAHCKRV